MTMKTDLYKYLSDGKILDNRVEISNPGGLPRGLSEKDFGRRAVRRNQLIASLLHRIDFVENMGTGINKIRTLLKIAGLPPPHFEFGEFYTIIFHREQHVPQTVEKTSGKTSGKIIELILQNSSITIPEMALQIGITERSVERNIRKLQTEGKLKRFGPAKGGYWLVVKGEE